MASIYLFQRGLVLDTAFREHSPLNLGKNTVVQYCRRKGFMRKPHALEEHKSVHAVPENHHASLSISTTYVMVIPRDSTTACEIPGQRPKKGAAFLLHTSTGAITVTNLST